MSLCVLLSMLLLQTHDTCRHYDKTWNFSNSMYRWRRIHYVSISGVSKNQKHVPSVEINAHVESTMHVYPMCTHTIWNNVHYLHKMSENLINSHLSILLPFYGNDNFYLLIKIILKRKTTLFISAVLIPVYFLSILTLFKIMLTLLLFICYWFILY